MNVRCREKGYESLLSRSPVEEEVARAFVPLEVREKARAQRRQAISERRKQGREDGNVVVRGRFRGRGLAKYKRGKEGEGGVEGDMIARVERQRRGRSILQRCCRGGGTKEVDEGVRGGVSMGAN